MKKILILALFGDPTLPAGIANTGGFNQTLRELLAVLAALNLPICVITDTTSYQQEQHSYISDDIELFRVFVTQEEHTNQENLRNSQDRILTEIYDILGADIINIAIVHSFYWFSGHLAKRIKEEKNIPYIHTPVSLSYNKTSTGHAANCPFQVDCERAFLQKADMVLAITDQEAKILSEQYQIKEQNIIVTGRSVDAVFHTPARDDNGIPRNTAQPNKPPGIFEDAPWWLAGAFLYLGRIVPIKGVLQIIRAWDILRKKYGREMPPLWLVGGSVAQISDFRREILKSVPNLPVYEAQHEVVWWGYLDQASISALLLKTLALVTHSQFEAGGRVVLEAMCQGRPVIATPNGFAADYVQDWANGFLVPYGDCDRLSRCMEFFVRQPYLACAMGNAAKYTFQQIERDWNYAGIHQALYEHYLIGTTKVTRPKHTKLSVQFTEEQTEKVDCFPYADISFTEAEWRQLLSSRFRLPITKFETISTPENHAHHYMLETGGVRFRVKQFYNRLNADVIWNGKETKKVCSAMEQICHAIQSQQLQGVAPLIHYSKVGSYYIQQELEHSHIGWENLYHLLNTFSATPLYPTLNQQMEDIGSTDGSTGALGPMLEALAASSRALGTVHFQKLLAMFPQIQAIEEESRKDIVWGFNYGKPLSGHVLLQKGQFVLLPTACWHFGEIGLDYIHAALWMGQKICALPGQSSDMRQYLWLLEIAWQRLLQIEWRGAAPSHPWTARLSQALAALKLDGQDIIS